VFISVNNGTNWSALNNGITSANINSFAVSGTNIFAGATDGVYLLTNNGTLWLNRGQGLVGVNSNSSVSSLLVVNNFIYAGLSGNSVWKRSLTEIIGIQNISSEIPSSFSLSQNYPNPFNPTTNIEFAIAKSGFVSLKVYDILGKEASTLVNNSLAAGKYKVDFNASNLTSGIYFYKLSSEGFSDVKRMVLIK
jgi:hypothetical protein